jgi:hypothetical protein
MSCIRAFRIASPAAAGVRTSPRKYRRGDVRRPLAERYWNTASITAWRDDERQRRLTQASRSRWQPVVP